MIILASSPSFHLLLYCCTVRGSQASPCRTTAVPLTAVHVAAERNDCEAATDGRMQGGAFDAAGCGRIRQAPGARQVPQLPRRKGRKRRVPGLRAVQEPDHRHRALLHGARGGESVRPQGAGGRGGRSWCGLVWDHGGGSSGSGASRREMT